MSVDCRAVISVTGGSHSVHLLSEELAPLFPGELVVERSSRLVLVGLVCWRRRTRIRAPQTRPSQHLDNYAHLRA